MIRKLTGVLIFLVIASSAQAIAPCFQSNTYDSDCQGTYNGSVSDVVLTRIATISSARAYVNNTSVSYSVAYGSGNFKIDGVTIQLATATQLRVLDATKITTANPTGYVGYIDINNPNGATVAGKTFGAFFSGRPYPIPVPQMVPVWEDMKNAWDFGFNASQSCNEATAKLGAVTMAYVAAAVECAGGNSAVCLALPAALLAVRDAINEQTQACNG